MRYDLYNKTGIDEIIGGIALPPRPDSAEDIISLNGSWSVLKTKNAAELTEAGLKFEEYCTVPSEFPLDGIYFLRKTTVLPKWNGGKTVLRFYAVNHRAEVYVNGKLAGRHSGSFTDWDVDITEAALKNENLEVAVKIDPACGISTQNGCGILRGAEIIHFKDYRIESLSVKATYSAESIGHLSIEAALNDNTAGLRAELKDGETVLFAGDMLNKLGADIKNIIPWSAYEPKLYTLVLKVIYSQTIYESVTLKIGFKSVSISQEKLLINGKPVLLKGICRQDIECKIGRCENAEWCEDEIIKYKQANINYIHCLNQPPSEAFLNICDREGIYVKADVAIADVDYNLPATQNDPSLVNEYVRAAVETAYKCRNHPCVIMYGLGSDCSWGLNFKAAKYALKKTGGKLPVVFHLPMTMAYTTDKPEIWPVHECSYELDFNAYSDHMRMMLAAGTHDNVGHLTASAPDLHIPVLHDAVAKIPCDDRAGIAMDPAIHLFWAQSFAKIWSKIKSAPNAIGGAVLGGVDDCDAVLNRNRQWGILDENHLTKPEYYALRHEYSPVKIKIDSAYSDGEMTYIPYECEDAELDKGKITFVIDVAGGALPPQNIELEPGFIKVKAMPEQIKVVYALYNSKTVDAVYCSLKQYSKAIPNKPSALKLYENAENITICNAQMKVVFDKALLLITEVSFNGEKIIEEGPYLHAAGWQLGEYKGESYKVKEQTDDYIVITMSGEISGQMKVTFDIKVGSDLTIGTSYRLDEIKIRNPGKTRSKAGMKQGGLDEIGIKYRLADGTYCYDFISANSFTCYDESSMGRLSGTVLPHSCADMFKNVNEDFFLTGEYTPDINSCRDWRCSRENLKKAHVYNKNGKGILIEDESLTFRMDDDFSDSFISCNDSSVQYLGSWYKVSDCSGAFKGVEAYSNEAGAYAEFKFTGTGIVVYGARDMIGGIADIYLDDKYITQINQFCLADDMPGFSRGYEKRRYMPLFARQKLADTEHTLRIVVSGKKEAASQSVYVMLEKFLVINREFKPKAAMLLINQKNFTGMLGGNYTRPAINISDGYENSVSFMLRQKEE